MALFYLLLLLCLYLPSALSRPNCYLPDKKTIAFGEIPCTSDTYAACCAPDAYCLQNGLCLTNLTLLRGSCTDQTWTSPNCAQFCQDTTPNKNTSISPCQPDPNPLFGCGFRNCANSNFSMPIRNVSILLQNYQAAGLGFVPSGEKSTFTTASISSERTSSDETPSPIPQCGSDNGKATAVGVGVGVSFGIALITALIFFGLEKRKNRRLKEEHSRAVAQQQVLHNRIDWYEKQNIVPWSPTQEACQERVYGELASSIHTHELTGGTSPKAASNT